MDDGIGCHLLPALALVLVCCLDRPRLNTRASCLPCALETDNLVTCRNGIIDKVIECRNGELSETKCDAFDDCVTGDGTARCE